MSALILYIEDNPDNMRLVRKALEARGYEVVAAINGVEGLEKANSSQPDLILLDINLPDIDGYDVARNLRKSSDMAVTSNPHYRHHCQRPQRGR